MPSTYTAVSSVSSGAVFTDEAFNALAANDDFFRNPPQATYSPALGAANITTTSTTLVDLTGFSVTLTTQGGNVLVLFTCRASVVTVRFDLNLDGSSVTGDSDYLGAPAVNGEVSIIRILSMAAGSHTIKVQWKTTSGTGTVYPASLCMLHAREF